MIGFWASPGNDDLPNPADFVDGSWDESERQLVDDYLASGQVAAAWIGASRCRLCKRVNGSRDFTDGFFLWPEGLGHYVLDHGVRLPAEFLAHIDQRRDELDELDRDMAWWLQNAHRT
jgi:hypothetical protein